MGGSERIYTSLLQFNLMEWDSSSNS